MHNLTWQFFEDAVQRRGDAWARKAQSGIVAPDSFALILCYGNINSQTDVSEILSYELPIGNGYERKAVDFDPYDSHLKTWVSKNIVFAATQDITFNNMIVLSNIPISANSLTVTSVNNSNTQETLTIVGHGLTEDSPIMMSGILPYPLQSNIVYYTKVVDSDNIKVRFAPAGAVIDIVGTFTGSFSVIPYLSLNPPRPEIFANLQTSETVKAGDNRVVRVEFPL